MKQIETNNIILLLGAHKWKQEIKNFLSKGKEIYGKRGPLKFLPSVITLPHIALT